MAGSSTNRSPSNTFNNFMCDQHTISDPDFISAFYAMTRAKAFNRHCTSKFFGHESLWMIPGGRSPLVATLHHWVPRRSHLHSVRWSAGRSSAVRKWRELRFPRRCTDVIPLELGWDRGQLLAKSVNTSDAACSTCWNELWKLDKLPGNELKGLNQVWYTVDKQGAPKMGEHVRTHNEPPSYILVSEADYFHLTCPNPFGPKWPLTKLLHSLPGSGRMFASAESWNTHNDEGFI